MVKRETYSKIRMWNRSNGFSISYLHPSTLLWAKNVWLLFCFQFNWLPMHKLKHIWNNKWKTSNCVVQNNQSDTEKYAKHWKHGSFFLKSRKKNDCLSVRRMHHEFCAQRKSISKIQVIFSNKLITKKKKNYETNIFMLNSFRSVSVSVAIILSATIVYFSLYTHTKNIYNRGYIDEKATSQFHGHTMYCVSHTRWGSVL